MSTEFFNWHNHCGRNTALGSTQLPAEISTSGIFWGIWPIVWQPGKLRFCGGIVLRFLHCEPIAGVWSSQICLFISVCIFVLAAEHELQPDHLLSCVSDCPIVLPFKSCVRVFTFAAEHELQPDHLLSCVSDCPIVLPFKSCVFTFLSRNVYKTSPTCS